MLSSCFWNFLALLNYFVWWIVCTRITKCSHQWFSYMVILRVFLGYYSKVNMVECNQNNSHFLDDFVRFITWTTVHFLEVCAHVSSKVTTNGSFRGKETSKVSIFEAIILKQNEGVQPKYFVFFDDFGTLG